MYIVIQLLEVQFALLLNCIDNSNRTSIARSPEDHYNSYWRNYPIFDVKVSTLSLIIQNLLKWQLPVSYKQSNGEEKIKVAAIVIVSDLIVCLWRPNASPGSFLRPAVAVGTMASWCVALVEWGVMLTAAPSLAVKAAGVRGNNTASDRPTISTKTWHFSMHVVTM